MYVHKNSTHVISLCQIDSLAQYILFGETGAALFEGK